MKKKKEETEQYIAGTIGLDLLERGLDEVSIILVACYLMAGPLALLTDPDKGLAAAVEFIKELMAGAAGKPGEPQLAPSSKLAN